MPNDCGNFITIYAPAETISMLVDAKERLTELVKEPAQVEDSERFYDWQLDRRGAEAVQFRFFSAWTPPIAIFSLLIHKLPIKFMKVSWCVEDGIAGVWVGERSATAESGYMIQSMTWDEGCIEEKAERWRSA